MLEIIIYIGLAILIGPMLFMNTVGPFIIWKTQKIPARVKFVPIVGVDYKSEMSHQFLVYERSLESNNFKCIGSSSLSDSHSNSFFSLYWNPELKLAAMSVTLKSAVQEITYVELTQKYENGTVLDVSNSKQVEAYPKLDLKIAFRFPKIENVNELIDIHAKLKRQFRGNSKPVSFDIDRGFEEVEEFLFLESEALYKKGICKKEIDTDGKRGLTLWGAICLTYKSVNPGKKLFSALSERRALKVLKSA